MSTFKLPQTAFILGLLIGSLVVPSSAIAADLDPGYADVPAPIPQQQVTFGSGWYVRGDIAATDGVGVSAGNSSYKDAFTGPGLAPPSLTASKSKNLTYDADIGAGYQFTPYFRVDAVFDYNQPITSSHVGAGHKCVTGDYINALTLAYGNTYTTCTPTFAAKLTSYDVLLNAYIDLGTWYGVTPYVGGGVGAAFGTASASSSFLMGNNLPYDITYTSALNGAVYNQNWDRSQTRNYTNLAYALMAGFGYNIYPHTSLDIGYRYINLGRVFGAQITTQQVRAGLRYMIDN